MGRASAGPGMACIRYEYKTKMTLCLPCTNRTAQTHTHTHTHTNRQTQKPQTHTQAQDILAQSGNCPPRGAAGQLATLFFSVVLSMAKFTAATSLATGQNQYLSSISAGIVPVPWQELYHCSRERYNSWQELYHCSRERYNSWQELYHCSRE